MPPQKSNLPDNLAEYARANDGELPFPRKSKSTHLTGRLKANSSKTPARYIIIVALILGFIGLGFLGVTIFGVVADNNVSNEEQVLLDYFETSNITLVDDEMLMTQRIATCELSADETLTNSVEIVGVAWNSASQKYGITPIGALADRDNFVIYQLADLDDWYYIDALPSANMRFAHIESADNMTCTAF